MKLDDFIQRLTETGSEEDFKDFCRKYVLHGVPYVFHRRENDYFEFRKKIGKKFKISFHEIYIIGSAKLGYSPFKGKIFDLDSDIDVVLISSKLFDRIMHDISGYQMKFRRNRSVVSNAELEHYHKFLEYTALGWIRPDKLPVSFQMKTFKDDWFDFFRSISNGKSEVGNYQVAAGVFKSYQHLEAYIFSGFEELRAKHRRGINK